MGASYSLIETEKRTWTDHTIVYDEKVRVANLVTLEKAFPDGINIRLGYQDRKVGGLDYQHWFIVDETSQYFLEFSSPDDYYSARVQINTFPHCPCVYEKLEIIMNQEIRDRMLHVLGMSNYSLCLRNCEHVANYVFRGRWVSFQMDDIDGPLMVNYFKKVILDENKRKVNTFPSSIRPEAFKEGNGKKLYSFMEKHYNATEFSYYLDSNEKTYNILVVGPTGAGKSRLINVFFNQPVSESRVSHKSVTKEICFIKGRGIAYDYEKKKLVDRKIVVADTVGLCDTDWDDAKIVSLIKSRVSSNFQYIDAVFVVFRADRLLKTHVSNIKKIMEWLGYYKKENQYLNFLFVGTSAENLCEEDISRLKKEAVEILSLKETDRPSGTSEEGGDSKHFSSLVYTGFPPESSLNEKGVKGVEYSWDLLQPLLHLSPEGSLKRYYEDMEQKKIYISRLRMPKFSSCHIL